MKFIKTKYASKILWRNKNRTVKIMLAVLICSAVIAGLFITANKNSDKLGESLFGTQGYDVKIEFTADLSEEQAALESIRKQEMYSEVISINYGYCRQSRIFGPDEMDYEWASDYDWNKTEKENGFSMTNFLGIDCESSTTIQDLFRDTYFSNTFRLVDLNESLYNTGGFLLELEDAENHNLTIGDSFNFGVIYIDPNNVSQEFLEENLILAGIVEINVNSSFLSTLSYTGFRDYSQIILAQYSTIQQLTDAIQENMIITNYFSSIESAHLITFNPDLIYINNFVLLQTQMSEMTDYLLNVQESYEREWLIRSNFIENLGQFEADYSKWLLMIIIVSIPLILQGVSFMNQNFDLIYLQRRKEVGLIKAKGVSRKQIMSLFFMESFLTISIGSMIGIFLGNGFSEFILKKVVLNEEISFIQFIGAFFNFNFCGALTFGFIYGVALILGLISSLGPIRKYSKTKDTDLLQGYDEFDQQDSKISKITVIMFVLALFALYTISSDIINQTSPFSSSFILQLTYSIASPMAPFLGSIMLYGLISIGASLFPRVMNRIANMIVNTKIPMQFRTAFQSIGKNGYRTSRIVFVFAFSFGLFLNGFILSESEKNHFNEVKLIEMGNGVVSSAGIMGYEPDNINQIARFLREESQYEITNVNWYYYSHNWNPVNLLGNFIYNTDGLEYYSSDIERNRLMIASISAKNFSDTYQIPDSWVEGDSYSNLLNRLITQKNATLLPMEMKSAYIIGDNITVQYNDQNVNNSKFTFEIIGFYSQLPIVSASYTDFSMIIDQSALFAPMNAYIIAETTQEIPNSYISFVTSYGGNTTAINNFISQYQPEFSDDSSLTQKAKEYLSSIEDLIRFTQYQNRFLFVLILFGVGNMIFSVSADKKHTISLMRVRNIEKPRIFRTQMIELAIIGIFGAILANLGIYGVKGLIFQQTAILHFENYTLSLFIPWNSMIGLNLLGLGGFLLISMLSIHLVLQKSNIGEIANIMRIRK